MGARIILKKSAVRGRVPTTLDLATGEVAVNLVDRRLYVNDGAQVVALRDVYVSPTAPGGPSKGDLWYNETMNRLETFNGSDWESSQIRVLTDVPDVEVVSLAHKDFLTWDADDAKWVNRSLNDYTLNPAPHLHSIGDITGFTDNSVAWNAAFSWGNHALAGYAADNHSHTINEISGFTDNSANWNTAFSWGDHSAAGYASAVHSHSVSDLTDFTDNSANWNTAFSWGDHGAAGYAAGDHVHSIGDIAGFTDNSTNWNLAVSWGNHASAGYSVQGHKHPVTDITGFTDNSSNWNAAFSWGDHGAQGYALAANVLSTNWIHRSGNYTAASGDRVAADVSSAAWTLTLPSSPSSGQTVVFSVVRGDAKTNNLTVDANGSTINGSSTLDVDLSMTEVSLVFDTEWRIA